MKQIIKKINYLKVLEIIFAVVLVFAPLLVSQVGHAALADTFRCDPKYQNCDVTDVNGLIRKVLNWMLGIAFGVAVLFLVIGGFWYITSAGNEETAEKGRNTAINAIIGIVIIILSYVIVQVVSNLIGGQDRSVG